MMSLYCVLLVQSNTPTPSFQSVFRHRTSILMTSESALALALEEHLTTVCFSYICLILCGHCYNYKCSSSQIDTASALSSLAADADGQDYKGGHRRLRAIVRLFVHPSKYFIHHSKCKPHEYLVRNVPCCFSLSLNL